MSRVAEELIESDSRRVSSSRDAGGFAVVLVTYNSERDLPGLMEDLRPAIDSAFCEIVAVDNGSTDSTVSILNASPGVRVLQGEGNPGYAAAINIARREIGRGRAMLILNPDVRIGAAALADLAAAVELPGIGIAVPTVLDSNGAVYPSLRREPSLMRAVGDALFGARFPGRPARLSEMIWETSTYARISAVDWATGAALMVSSDCADTVGDWDEQRFFMYSEETDFCRRARAGGHAVSHVASAQVVHAGGGSGSSPALEALMAVNRIRYYRKHHGRGAAVAFWTVVAVSSLLRFHRPGQRAALAAMLSPRVLAGLPGGRRGW